VLPTATSHVKESFWNSLAVSLAVAFVCASGFARDMASNLPAEKSAVGSSLAAALKGANSGWIQQAELTASDGAINDTFGQAVALSGNILVIGAPLHTVGSNSQQGAAYVFVESGGIWNEQAELTASNGKAGDGFGVSVAISGSTIVVGAMYSNTQQGAAYVFVESGGTWSQQAELTASDGGSYQDFGFSVAVSGSTIVVGAYNHPVGSNSSQGAAYVFVQSGASWSQQAELTSSDGGFADGFGQSVAVSGSTALVGAPRHEVGSNYNQGAAYVFAENAGSWIQQAELIASNGVTGAGFGNSVAISGTSGVVLGGGTGEGGAYVFAESGSTWTLQAELTVPNGFCGVAVDRSIIVAGACVYLQAGYVFAENNGTWSQQVELTASDSGSQDLFGNSVAVSGSTVAVGAPNHNVGSNSGQGVAYLFVPLPTTITFSLTSASFGNQAVNTTSAAKTVTLKNTGTATLYNSRIAITAGNSFFAISSNTCGATLAVGKTCKVSVTFTPTQLAMEKGTLTFTDNASGSPQTVSLTGAGVAPATLSPSSRTFPKTKVGSTSAAYNFTLKNNLSTTLTGVSYSTAAPFAVSTSTCTATLDSKESCAISVTFSPSVTGASTGTLTVKDSANDSPQKANLSGTGD
jgi:nucleoside-specific outer membrane channel protein Tsx